MNFKTIKAGDNTQTRDMEQFNVSGNVYESVAIIAKRANQISAEMKQEISHRLEEFASLGDSLEEVFDNVEQKETSKFYERLPKPSLIATDEFLDNKLYVRKVASK